MALPTAGQVGPVVAGDGTFPPFRQGRSGECVVTELHGRFYEQAFREALFSGGMTLTSISAATFTTATLGATCTPIVGVWNPGTSTKNLVILQATLNAIITAATNTGPGGFVWAVSTGNNAISTGNNPLNRKTLAKSGSVAKDMSGVALTGLTNNLVLGPGSALGGGSSANFSFVGTAAGQATANVGAVENLDGSIMVPPGGVLALLATTTAVAHSAVSGLLWEEVPV